MVYDFHTLRYVGFHWRLSDSADWPAVCKLSAHPRLHTDPPSGDSWTRTETDEDLVSPSTPNLASTVREQLQIIEEFI
jgi:hypothetical protein